MAFGEKNHMFIVGHTLVWHNQTPAWVFQDDHGNPVDRETLLARMREHIHTVVGRYKGRIAGWDVVNEALNEDGTLRQSPWLKIIGEDYIAKAFQFAHEADPKAELYYNDYSLENEAKRNGGDRTDPEAPGAGRAGDSRRPARARPHGLAHGRTGGCHHRRLRQARHQSEHHRARHRRAARRDASKRAPTLPLSADLQAKLNPYAKGLPDQVQQALAKRYADLFAVFLKHRDVITRVTFWGVTDGDSWLNDWPVKGRTSYPLLFDRQGQPKPAFVAVAQLSGDREGAGVPPLFRNPGAPTDQRVADLLVAHDRRRKSLAAHERFARHRAPGHPGL